MKYFSFENKKTIFVHLLVLLSYVAATLIVCWYLLPQLGSSILKHDNMLLHWMISWNMHALATDPLNILQANIFFPHENTLLYSDLLLPQSIMAIPVTLLTGNSILAYNLLILLFYVLSAYGMYLLARYYTKHHYASWIAGLIFGFSTYRIISIVHFQDISVFFIPFAILLLEKYFDTFKSKYSIGFTILFILQALASWYAGAFLGFFTIFIMVMHHKTIRKHAKRVLIDFLVAMILLAIGIGPFALAYFRFAAEQNSAYTIDLAIRLSADFGGYLLPSPYSLPGKIVGWIGLTKERWGENIHFLGLGPLFLVGYAVVKKLYRKKMPNSRMYLIGLPIFLVLSFGPFLHLFDQTLKIPLPYLLIYNIPAFQFMRVVSRLAILVLFCVALISAFSIVQMKWKRKWLMYFFACILPVSILLESFDTKRETSVAKHIGCVPIYASVDESIPSLLELPVSDDPFETVDYVFNSRCHNFTPIYNGYSGFVPHEYMPSNTVLATFPSQIAVDYMALLGMDHAIVHTKRFKKSQNIESTIEQSQNIVILDKKKSDFLVQTQPGSLNRKSWYFNDFRGYEQNTLASTVVMDNAEQRDVIGGQGLGVIVSKPGGETLVFPSIETAGHKKMRVALQGLTQKEKGYITIDVTDDTTQQSITKKIELADFGKWEEVIFELAPQSSSSTLTVTLHTSENSTDAWLTTLFITLNK